MSPLGEVDWEHGFKVVVDEFMIDKVEFEDQLAACH